MDRSRDRVRERADLVRSGGPVRQQGLARVVREPAGAGYLRDGEDRAQRGDGLRVSIGVVAERVAQGEVARTSGGARGADLARVGGLAEPVHGVELPEGTLQIAGIHTVNQAGVR